MKNKNNRALEEAQFFIRCVQQNPCLYDKADAFYFNKEKKVEAWNNISDETQKSMEECKSRWKAIREKYSRELKKKEHPSEDGTDDGVEWELMENLNFLKQSMKRRRKESKSTLIEVTPDTEEDAEITHFITQNIVPADQSSKSKNNPLQTLCDQFGTFIKKFEEQIVDPLEKNEHEDEDTLFFASLVPLIKSLPIEARDKFKTEMMIRIMELRSIHRNKNQEHSTYTYSE